MKSDIVDLLTTVGARRTISVDRVATLQARGDVAILHQAIEADRRSLDLSRGHEAGLLPRLNRRVPLLLDRDENNRHQTPGERDPRHPHAHLLWTL